MTDDKKREVQAHAHIVLQYAVELAGQALPLPIGGQQVGGRRSIRSGVRSLEASILLLKRLLGLAAGPDVSRVYNWPPQNLEFWAAQNDGKAVLVEASGRWFLVSCEDAADPASLLDTPLLYIGPFELPEPL